MTQNDATERPREATQGGQLAFYVFSDLSARTPDIERFSGIQEALDAYQRTVAEHPQWQTALGGELGTGALDFVHHRDGRDVLLKDVSQLESWSSHPEVQQAVKEISKQLHLEDPSLEQLKQQARERAHEKNERNAKSPSRPKRGELEL